MKRGHNLRSHLPWKPHNESNFDEKSVDSVDSMFLLSFGKLRATMNIVVCRPAYSGLIVICTSVSQHATSIYNDENVPMETNVGSL